MANEKRTRYNDLGDIQMPQVVLHTFRIRLSDALYGTKRLLERDGRRLEVKIPPRIKDSSKIKLTNVLAITDNRPGDIIIQINVEPRPVIDPAKGANIDNIFQSCLYAVGGINNDHVNDYLDSRGNHITRQLFFEKAVWAIWVAGWGQKQCDTFLNESRQDGFTWDFSIFGQWSNSQLIEFMNRRHLGIVPERARKKWEAVHKIAKWLNSFSDDRHFRLEVFEDKLKGKYLDRDDVYRLIHRKLPFIGEANSFYITRMLGGEEIKDDRWMKQFRSWGDLDLNTLEHLLATNDIPRGFFDVVIWEYCNMFVEKVDRLKPHLTSKFGYLR